MPLFFQSFVLLAARELRGLPLWALSLQNPGLWGHSWLVVLTKQKGSTLEECKFTGAAGLATVATTDQ